MADVAAQTDAVVALGSGAMVYHSKTVVVEVEGAV